MSTAWWAQEGSLRLRVRLTPNGGRDAIDSLEPDAEGQCHLKARVSAVPEDGKANKALIALLAKNLKVPKSSISIISGDTSRKKMLRIDADPEHLIERLESLIS
jgi:uncharacterized protein (TIGR00251 family)